MAITIRAKNAITLPFSRFKAFEDELISSYVARMSHALGVTPYTILKEIFKYPQGQNQDIDRSVPLFLLNLFSASMGEKCTCLNTKLRWLRLSPHFYSQDPNILDLGIRGRKYTKPGLQYCPLCLKEHCYFKASWRVSLLPVCPKHQCLLLNTCPNCETFINPLNSTLHFKDIGYCLKCNSNLRKSNVNYIKDYDVFFKALYLGIQSGWFSYKSHNLYMPLVIAGFWRIIYSFYGIRSQKIDAWNKLCRYFGKPSVNLSFTRPYNNFKVESPLKRLDILSILIQLLDNWPNNLVEAFRHAGITAIMLNPSHQYMPFWLHSISNNQLNLNWYRVSIDEILSCANYLYANNKKITTQNIALHLGRDASKRFSSQELSCLKNLYPFSSL